MITLQPETKTPVIVTNLLRGGVFCPVEEFKCEVAADGDAIAELAIDPCNNARFILVSGRAGSSGSLDIVVHLPSGGTLKKSFPVSVVAVGEDPDDFEIAVDQG